MPQTHIANLLKQAIGVDAATMGRSVLTNAVRARMAACGLTEQAEYLERLRHSPGELAHLIELVVVPETWFFRDAEAFSALVQLVRTEWLPAHPAGRLRILSAPSSTGEEPYSIAMALLDAGLPAPRFQIDAIDISERALEQARRATYGRNSFRGSNLGFRERYFDEVPGGHQLRSSVRECVEFRRGNLVADDWQPGSGCYDFIFCRNVLIYFDADTQERVVRALDRLLSPSGVLFVGPAEAFVTRTAGFSTADFPCAFACRRSSAGRGKVPSLFPLTTPSLPAVPSFTAPAAGKKPVAKTPAKPAPVLKSNTKPKPVSAPVPAVPVAGPSAAAAVASLDAATRLADAGHLPEALAACEAHLRDHGPSAGAVYLLALVRDTLGDSQEAARQYRKVLYLDPHHAEALLHLALLAEKEGDLEGARRLQQRARRTEEVSTR